MKRPGARPIRNAAICRRYAEGEKLTAIGSDYGLTKGRIGQIAREGGMPLRVRQRRLPPCVFLPVLGEIRLVSVPAACR